MNSPLRILETLDRHLTAPAEITLFGRAALALGCEAGSATLDLILTKMARGDENAPADIAFLLTREPLTADQLRAAFARARVPDIPEAQALFLAAQPQVLALAKASEQGGSQTG